MHCVLSCHEVFADLNGKNFHSAQGVEGVSGIMGMTYRKEERGHLFDSIEMECPICLSLSSNVLEDGEDGFDQAIHQCSCSRLSMLWKVFFPKRGHNSSSTSILRALAFRGNFLALNILNTPPKSMLGMSTIPWSAISVPMHRAYKQAAKTPFKLQTVTMRHI